MEYSELKNETELANFLFQRSRYFNVDWHGQYVRQCQLDPKRGDALSNALIRRVNASLKNGTPPIDLNDAISELLDIRRGECKLPTDAAQKASSTNSPPAIDPKNLSAARIAEMADEIREIVTNGGGWGHIAAQWNVSKSTVLNWSERHPALRRAYDEALASRRGGVSRKAPATERQDRRPPVVLEPDDLITIRIKKELLLQAVVSEIADKGSVSSDDMYRTFGRMVSDQVIKSLGIEAAA